MKEQYVKETRILMVEFRIYGCGLEGIRRR